MNNRLTAIAGARSSTYLTDELDRANERYQYYVHSFEQSRRFRGLKVWMSFKRYGASQIGEWIDNNVRQAKHLYSLVAKHPEFEAASEPPMSGQSAFDIRAQIWKKRNPRSCMLR